MTVVRCLMSECRSWLNERCSRRKITVVGTKCLDFTRRKSQFRNVTTTIECDQKQCVANSGGICRRGELIMKGDGCDWKIMGEKPSL